MREEHGQRDGGPRSRMESWNLKSSQNDCYKLKTRVLKVIRVIRVTSY
jgi:hypothetical protein